MIDDAMKHLNFPMLKVKLDQNNLEECLKGIRKVSPNSTLILDANESFDFKTLDTNMDLFLETDVGLIEQPLSCK
jgi:L-alanine-DL-glutamate epimerase-like enolase superfamily enzyme